jgi:hypothetical protein
MKLRFPGPALLIAALPLFSGCIVAAAGAGAAAGVYLSDRGASSLVEGTLPQVDARAQAAMRSLSIEVTETRAASDGSRREYRGRTAEVDVVLELESRGGSTQVSATAKRSAVEWDREYARRLVQRVVEQR